DVTEQSGVGGDENTWSTGATWIDYDGDGRLDLVVAHYARWPQDVPLAAAFTIADVGRSYGAPTGFVSAFPSVYRNLGGGRFANLQAVTALTSGAHDETMPFLPAKFGIASIDYDLDGHQEIFSGSGRAEPDVNKFGAGRAFAAAPQLLWSNGSAWRPANIPA